MSQEITVVELFQGLMVQLLTWMVGVLPDSPFVGVDMTLTAVPNAIGWLNWVCPVGRCLQLYGAWLTCAAAWQLVQFVGAKITYVQGIGAGGDNQLPSGGDER